MCNDVIINNISCIVFVLLLYPTNICFIYLYIFYIKLIYFTLLIMKLVIILVSVILNFNIVLKQNIN